MTDEERRKGERKGESENRRPIPKAGKVNEMTVHTRESCSPSLGKHGMFFLPLNKLSELSDTIHLRRRHMLCHYMP